MEIRTYLGDVRFLEADLILAGLYEDERPLQGLSGLVDWCLFGQLSDLILDGRFAGRLGDFALLATQGRISAPKFMLAGLGPRRELTPGVVGRMLPEIARRVGDLKVGSVAMETIGNRGAGLGPGEAAGMLMRYLREGGPEGPAESLMLLPADEPEQEALEKLLW